MVSIVLLTTEEVLERNGFWYRLDTVWVTEELEPFEEVKHEHLFLKPLSRDFYYTKFPDIPRSESEDENTLSLNGFRNKHQEWKTKIRVKKFVAQRRNSSQSHSSWSGCKSTSNPSINVTRRLSSLVEENNDKARLKLAAKNNDDRIRDFFNRLIKSVPPPPIELLQKSSTDLNLCSITEPPQEDIYFSDIDVPDYVDFENGKILERNLLPTTSTLKKSQRKVSFNLSAVSSEFEIDESWYDDSIYGVQDSIQAEKGYKSIEASKDFDYFPSWSEILNDCGINASIAQNKEESSATVEEVISQSHCADAKHEQYIEIDEDDDEELGYARFAIYKIHQTLKIQGKMLDSSPMKDFNYENDADLHHKTQKDTTFYGAVYRLAPKPLDEIQEYGPNGVMYG